MPKQSPPNVQDTRLALNMSQGEFWRQLNVTQSGGSRYESGRGMPRPVRRLMALALLPKNEALQLLSELRAPFDAAKKAAAKSSKAAAR